MEIHQDHILTHIAKDLANLHMLARKLGMGDVQAAIRECEVRVDAARAVHRQQFAHTAEQRVS